MTRIVACFAMLIVVGANRQERRFVAEPDIPELLQRLDGLTRRVAENEAKISKLSHDPIAFKAHLTAALSPGPNQRIIYDDVQLNLGNAYHRHSGAFIAPFNGTYLFSVSACSLQRHFIVLDLMNNGILIGKVLGGDTVYDDCSSETTIIQLKQADEVYVQHHEVNGDYIQVHPNVLNSFTGVLLQIA